jgi:dihydroorotase
MIDPHVHLRDWDQNSKETLYHGLRTAVQAGISGVFDMPNTAPPLISRDKIETRLADAAAAREKVEIETGKKIFYGLYGGLTADEKQIKEVVTAHRELFPSVVGLKLFSVHSTGNMGITSKSQQKNIFSVLASEGYRGVLAVHCEKHELLRPDLWDSDDPHSHSNARPPEAEATSIQEIIDTAAEVGFSGTLHICHISTPQSLVSIEAARENTPITITCGITPHHALLDTSFPQTGNVLKVNPPLRDSLLRKKLFQALVEGRIDWIESDHAPHGIEEKRAGASGIPGIAGYLLLVRELLTGGVSRESIRALTIDNVYRVFNLGSALTDFRENQLNESDLTTRAREASEEYVTDPYAFLHFLNSDNTKS